MQENESEEGRRYFWDAWCMCRSAEEGESSSSSHRVAALASVLADKMLESPEMVKLLQGDTSALKTQTASPKSVNLSTQF